MSKKRQKLATKVTDLPLVLVSWQDASFRVDHEATLGEKNALKSFGGLYLMEDVGFLVEITRTHIKLSVARCREDNTIRHANTIPRGWVRDIIVLTPAKEPQNAPTTPETAQNAQTT